MERMQLVMGADGKSLPKGSRALRAYCNVDKPPLGFKGNPLKRGQETTAYPLTHYHVSRYAYAHEVLEGKLRELVHVQKGEKGYTVKLLDALSRENLEDNLRILEERKQQTHDPRLRRDLVRFLQWVRSIPLHREFLETVKRQYSMLLAECWNRLPVDAADYADPSLEREFIQYSRQNAGLHTWVGLRLLAQLRLKNGVPSPTERDALRILQWVFYAKFMLESEDAQDASTNGMGRIVFDRRDTQACRFLRKHLFNDLSYSMLLDAYRMSGIAEIDQTRADRLLALHHRYACRRGFLHGDQHLQLEASPFIEKPVGEPVGNFELAIYPSDPVIRRALHTIRDPSFEHADGAVALAAFTLSPDHCILEEIQSDVPDLLVRAARRGIPVAAVRDTLQTVVGEWTAIAIQAARLFAGRNGYGQIFASTPWRIFRRYGAAFHPDKTRLYFDGLERLGGILVHDDAAKLDSVPQPYYRFSVE